MHSWLGARTPEGDPFWPFWNRHGVAPQFLLHSFKASGFRCWVCCCLFVCLAYNQGWSLLGKSFMEIKAKPFHLVMLSQL